MTEDAEYKIWKARKDEDARRQGAFWLTQEGRDEIKETWFGDDSAIPPTLLTALEKAEVRITELQRILIEVEQHNTELQEALGSADQQCEALRTYNTECNNKIAELYSEIESLQIHIALSPLEAAQTRFREWADKVGPPPTTVLATSEPLLEAREAEFVPASVLLGSMGLPTAMALEEDGTVKIDYIDWPGHSELGSFESKDWPDQKLDSFEFDKDREAKQKAREAHAAWQKLVELKTALQAGSVLLGVYSRQPDITERVKLSYQIQDWAYGLKKFSATVGSTMPDFICIVANGIVAITDSQLKVLSEILVEWAERPETSQNDTSLWEARLWGCGINTAHFRLKG